MEEHDVDRVHSGGIPTIPTTTVPQWRGQDQGSTEVQGWLVPSRAIRESQEEQEHIGLSYLSVAGVMYPNMTVVTLGTTI
jgi:hypothetical protein